MVFGACAILGDQHHPSKGPLATGKVQMVIKFERGCQNEGVKISLSIKRLNIRACFFLRSRQVGGAPDLSVETALKRTLTSAELAAILSSPDSFER